MICYLDSAATTKPCDAAIGAMMAALSEGYFNPSSLYSPAIQAEKALDRVRVQIRAALSAKPDAQVLFTSGGTEANNLAIIGTVSALYGPQHVISCAVEHPSVLAPLAALKDAGHRVTLIAPCADGSVDFEAMEKAILADPPALVSLMQVNNEVGAILDVPRLSTLIRRLAPSAKIHVDGVQGFLRLPLDMRQIDLYTLSAHKIHGPKGVGALVVNRGVRILPRQLGGGQQAGLRSGTENVPGIMGLFGAMSRGFEMGDLKRRFYEKVRAGVPNVLLNGPKIERGAAHIINLSFPGVRGEVLLHALEGDGVYCSTGSACSSKKQVVSPVLIAMSIDKNRAESALRFSFSPDTTEEETEYAAACVARQYQVLRRFARK